MNRTVRMMVMIAGVGVALVMAGCGPSAEERIVIEQFNQLEELIVKGGYVRELERFEGRDDRVFIVEAEIVNEEGLPIGRLRSERVEGFGTGRPRIQWYETPGVSEEWRMPQRGRGRGRGRQENRGNNEN